MRRMAGAVMGFVIAGCVGAAQQHDAHPNAKPAAAKTGPAAAQAKIRDAMSAAPAAISKNATIMDWPDKPGAPMTQLKAGTNGWMCMPSTGAGGGVSADPMCLDKSFSSWADAYINRKDPQLSATGIGYMLRGDKGASNTDPFAEAPTPTNQWVVSGPHLMLVFPDPKQLDAFPTDPNSGGPFVMWKGTKYAHVMVPVAAMPKQPAAKAAAQ